MQELTPQEVITSLQATIRVVGAERNKAVESLERIVSYYELQRHRPGMLSMKEQSSGEHENTMFGEARAILNQLGACVTTKT